VQVPQSFVSEVNNLAALVLVRGAEFFSAFDKPQREALAMLFLQLDHEADLVAQVFWGLWLFPLGLLVWRSRFLPRVIGGWLIANGFAYLANAFTGLLAPHYLGTVSRITFPVLFGELAFALWLVIAGVRPRPPVEPGRSPAAG